MAVGIQTVSTNSNVASTNVTDNTFENVTGCVGLEDVAGSEIVGNTMRVGHHEFYWAGGSPAWAPSADPDGAAFGVRIDGAKDVLIENNSITAFYDGPSAEEHPNVPFRYSLLRPTYGVRVVACGSGDVMIRGNEINNTARAVSVIGLNSETRVLCNFLLFNEDDPGVRAFEIHGSVAEHQGKECVEYTPSGTPIFNPQASANNVFTENCDPDVLEQYHVHVTFDTVPFFYHHNNIAPDPDCIFDLGGPDVILVPCDTVISTEELCGKTQSK